MNRFPAKAGGEAGALGLATVLALLCGFAAWEDPNLDALSLALWALAIAAWMVHLRPRGTVGQPLMRGAWAGLALAALGGAIYLWGAGPLAPARGILLGLSLLPLWASTRSPASSDPGGRS